MSSHNAIATMRASLHGRACRKILLENKPDIVSKVIKVSKKKALIKSSAMIQFLSKKV